MRADSGKPNNGWGFEGSILVRPLKEGLFGTVNLFLFWFGCGFCSFPRDEGSEFGVCWSGVPPSRFENLGSFSCLATGALVVCFSADIEFVDSLEAERSILASPGALSLE